MAEALTWTIEDAGDAARVKLTGEITERSDFAPLLAITLPTIVFDLAAIRRINSCGVGEWIDFADALRKAGHRVVLERCSVPVVHSLNMVASFRGGATITSAYVPYFCAECDVEHAQLVELPSEGKATLQEAMPCPTCNAAMELDDLPEAYLAFLG